MKAMVQERYGPPDVLVLRDVDRPPVSDNGVLVRVRAAGLNPLDAYEMRGTPLVMRPTSGWRRPRKPIRGYDVAGVVEEVGRQVTRFRAGDAVFGWCSSGAFAELAAAHENHLFPKPERLGFEEAGGVAVAAFTALQAVRDHGAVETGKEVLIVGASSGVGTFAVQIAKQLGARVTGVCSTSNVDLVRRIGADDVVDYTRSDISALPAFYDVVIHVAGHRSITKRLSPLKPDGVLVNAGGHARGKVLGPAKPFIAAAIRGRLTRKQVRSFMSRVNHADGLVLLDLLDRGAVVPVVDRTFPLVELPEAVRYLETRRARGKVIVTV